MQIGADRSRRSLGRAMLLLLAALAGMLFFFPLVWMLASAVRPGAEIFRFLSPLSLRTLIPETLTLDNFRQVLQGSFGIALVNSLIVSGVTVAIGLAICTTAAFGLSALRYRFRTAIFVLVVVSFMVPFDAIAIPLAGIFRTWGLQNTYAGLVLPGIANGFAIFLVRQFYLGVPPEMREAARVDGATWWAVFWRIYLPLSPSVLIGAGLILFLNQWQAYLWPLLIGTDQNMQLAPIALANLLGEFSVDFGQLFAGTVLVAIVPGVLMLFLQRYFTQSLTGSGSKL